MGYTDPFFASSWAALATLGAVRGGYHFARPEAGNAAGQADKFLSVVREWQPADLLVLDLEVGSGDLSGFALGFLERVRSRTGLTPWLYSYGPFIRSHLTDRRLATYPLWLAAYQQNPPTAPPPWSAWQLWQHTDRAAVPGVRTPCDESVGELPHPSVVKGLDMANVVTAIPDPQVSGGVWVFAKDGGVFTYGNARFLGSYPGETEQTRNVPRTLCTVEMNARGGYDLLMQQASNAPPERYSYHE